jgi:hypothetical protein
MGDVRTDVLLSFVGLLEGDHLDHICPSGKRMVVTNIDCAAGAASFAPLLGVEDLVTGGTWLVLAVNGVLLTSAQWSGRQVFNFGGGFRLNAHVENWDGRVSGYLLDLP